MGVAQRQYYPEPEPPPPTRRYSVFACDEGRQRAHDIDGVSYEDAAIGFLEAWHPAADADGEVELMVTDCETGREQCLRIEVGQLS
jgi:hypothetical protein